MNRHYRKNEEERNSKIILEQPVSNVIERSELIYNVLKTNKKLIDAFLVGDYTSMENWRILLNNYIDEELKNK